MAEALCPQALLTPGLSPVQKHRKNKPALAIKIKYIKPTV
jgi:hypothetical protein